MNTKHTLFIKCVDVWNWPPPIIIIQAIPIPGSNQRLVIVEPLVDMSVFLLVELHLDWFQWLHIQHVVGVVEGRLLIIKWREPHPLEVTSITLLTTHHDPHRTGRGGGRRVNGIDIIWCRLVLALEHA